ncbi:hypothetical protein HZA33_01705 [Candidatus Pacearchaeota archaeon]|nr:hypothetical protein [Candidatus Pacearchaeota archaeon]
MIVKFLGVLDLIAAIVLLLTIFNVVNVSSLLPFAIYLIIKAVIFLLGKDFASAVDLLVGIVFLLLVFKIAIPQVIPGIAAFWLIQKAFFSFFSSG